MVSDCLNASNRFFGMLLPRRSAKTTSLFAFALGRVAEREDYLVSYTMATTATKARQRFRSDLAAPLEQLFPDKRTRPFKISYAGGSENIEWLETGSRFQFLAPKGESFRSDAWDLIIVDESGEADADTTEDITSGAIATMDTRPDALMIAAGTAAEFRVGNLLWDTLEDGRNGANQTGILEYAAPATTTAEDLLRNGQKDWALAEPLLLGSHPGIGTLTTLDIMESNFIKLKPEQFLREYLSIFGTVGTANFINMVTFRSLADSGDLPTPPSHFRIALAVHPLQTSAAIVAAWRVNGKAQILVLEHKAGVRWIYDKVRGLAKKYRVPISYDIVNSANVVEIEKLGKAQSPKPRFLPSGSVVVATAASLLLKEIESGNLRHWNQPALDEAASMATKKGSTASKRWWFGGNETGDVTPLEAAALALRDYDEAKPRVPMKMIIGNEDAA